MASGEAKSKRLILYIDGASHGNPGPSGYGVVVEDARGGVLAELSGSLGVTTNNVAEYTALLKALEEARARGAEEVEIRTDSELLARQINGSYAVRSPRLLPLYQRARAALAGFRSYRVVHVGREENRSADALAGRGARAAEVEDR
ncbi:MAG: ribonuclease HI family protein [Clostridia bacterium]|jgi:ribonuclease HI|nr:ribonuclease HI family protein [Clostridia bacterium]